MVHAKSNKFYLLMVLIAIGAIQLYCLVTKNCKQGIHMAYAVKNSHDISNLFPKSDEKINELIEQSIKEAQQAIDKIITIPHDKRTFENTAKALDNISSLSNLAIYGHSVSVLEIVSPDEAIRNAAHQATLKLQQFWVDAVAGNKKLYNAFKAYAEGNALKENLNEEQKYYVSETVRDFIRAGLDLPQEQLEEVKKLKKEIAALTLEFDRNIAMDQSKVTVSQEELAGCDSDFINNLKKTEDDQYILGVDYPTYFSIMENCAVETTRKQLMRAFTNRAYPQNEKLLQEIIAKRDSLAKKLGYKSYAHLDLDNEMVGNPERAEDFTNQLIAQAQQKEQQEFEQLVKELPESVELTPEGKLKNWDVLFVKAAYKKKHFDLDEREIAEYFPMEKTVNGLLSVYEQFMGLQFKKTPIANVWHDEVQMLEVFEMQSNTLLGYLLLDLYPRAHKFSHACQVSIIPATYHENGEQNPAVSMVIANFPKSTAEKPSLLKRKDVNTFFHEFGHALHALLGRTYMASFAGTSVKRDFVEMPSQMLEEWLWDKDILKMVSNHYQTNEPLSHVLIEKILNLKHFDSGQFIQRQSYYTMISLACFKEGAQKDLNKLTRDLHEKIRLNTAFDPEGHMFASFGHLTGYGARYYGYMWSKVFALDLFDSIKKDGLLNFKIGKKYIDSVIGKGGSKEPIQLLEDFLGRKPNQEAFLRDLGLQKQI